MLSRASILITVLLLFCQVASAAPVYKWEDSDGIVHYSSKPKGSGAKPADLPPIMRGEVKVAKTNLISCKEHGGIDCRAGADKDGSVICQDGFKEASARFRFSCNSPKLEITEIGDLTDKGEFSVYVRNSTSVAASVAALFYKPDVGREVKLEGPVEIDPYGLAEFVFRPSGGDQTIIAKADMAQLNLTCANCP